MEKIGSGWLALQPRSEEPTQRAWVSFSHGGSGGDQHTNTPTKKGEGRGLLKNSIFIQATLSNETTKRRKGL